MKREIQLVLLYSHVTLKTGYFFTFLIILIILDNHISWLFKIKTKSIWMQYMSFIKTSMSCLNFSSWKHEHKEDDSSSSLVLTSLTFITMPLHPMHYWKFGLVNWKFESNLSLRLSLHLKALSYSHWNDLFSVYHILSFTSTANGYQKILERKCRKKRSVKIWDIWHLKCLYPRSQIFYEIQSLIPIFPRG